MRSRVRVYAEGILRRRQRKGLLLQQNMDFFFAPSTKPIRHWQRNPGKLLQRLRRQRGYSKWARLAKLKHKRRN